MNLLDLVTRDTHLRRMASRWWLSRLNNAKRWRPFWSDPNDLLQAGVDLSWWVEVGLE